MKQATKTSERLEYLRGELRAERISYGEISELQDLVPYIDPSDVELLEAAGVPENADDTPATTGVHTATPWKTGDGGDGKNGIWNNCRRVAVCSLGNCLSDDEPEANAAFIVRAVNSHDKLIKALRGLYDAVDSAVELTPEVMLAARAALRDAEAEK